MIAIKALREYLETKPIALRQSFVTSKLNTGFWRLTNDFTSVSNDLSV